MELHEVRAATDAQARKRSHRELLFAWRTYRRMFSLAVEWELLEESPMAGIRFLRENNARTRYLSLEECQRLIASCMAPHIRAMVCVDLQSVKRLGEIRNLRWTV